MEETFFDVADPCFPDLRPYLRPGSLVLDLGCGRGRNIDALTTQGFRTIALDCDAEHLAHVRSRGAAPTLCASLFALPLGDGCLDAIVVWQVLCQFSRGQIDALFHETHRVLAPTGLLVMVGCYSGAAWGGPFISGGRPVETPPTLPPTFVPEHSQVLDPVPGWPHLRWLFIARKAPSKTPADAMDPAVVCP